MNSSFSVLSVVLLSVLVCLLSPSSVSADGSITPYLDNWCSHPAGSGNATFIPVVTSPSCQWMTIDGVKVSFLYECNPQANFTLSFFYNTSYNCMGGDQWFSIKSDDLSDFCPVARYADNDSNILFYATIVCNANWPYPGKEWEGVKALTDVAKKNVEETASVPQQLLRSMADILPQSKRSMLHKLVRQLDEQKEQ